MAEQILIFPFNGNGIEALDCIQGQYEFIGFVDDTPEKQGKNEQGFEVFDRSAFHKFPAAKVLAVPGSPSSFTIRKKIIDALGIDSSRFAQVIHPKASVSPAAKLGKNILVMGGVWVSANASIGNHVCVLPNTAIHHDSQVGDYTLVGSNVTVAGYTTIGKSCYIGSGTSIINSIEIGDCTLIGMGTNVIKSLASNSKAVGNPAKLI